MSTLPVCHQVVTKGFLWLDSAEKGLATSDGAEEDEVVQTTVFSGVQLQLVHLKWIVSWSFPGPSVCRALQQRGELLNWKVFNGI